MSLRIRLAGLFNVYNALAAIAFALREDSGSGDYRGVGKVQGLRAFETIDEDRSSR